MGRKSIKEFKNIYHLSRENKGYTRERAAEKIGYISADRIEKIENDRTQPNPSDILAFAECYNDPYLCNHYCSNECPIGQKYIPNIKSSNLPSITLNLLSTINKLQNDKETLIDVTADGIISENEMEDFIKIQNHLDEMSLAIHSLQLWVENTINSSTLKTQNE